MTSKICESESKQTLSLFCLNPFSFLPNFLTRGLITTTYSDAGNKNKPVACRPPAGPVV